MIGQLCTCDVRNYGDLLYPVIFQKMAEKHGVGSGIVPLSFLEGPAPCDSGYVVRGINEVIKSKEQSVSHLVIGGGDILRTDVDVVADHYYSIFEKQSRKDFLFRLRKKLLGSRHVRKQFIKRFVGYSSIAPFILDRVCYPKIGSILYCSCGVPFRFSPKKIPAIRRAFESAAFVYVRDTQSREKLREAGVSREIEVAPDLIVTLSDFFNANEERSKGLKLLAEFGVDTTKSIICFQACPQEKHDELLQQLVNLKKNTQAEIVLLPIGFCHGDDVFLQTLAERSAGLLNYADVHSIYDILSVIAASQIFIGTSMHGNITAFSFGIPHLFGPIPVDKAEGFLDMVGLCDDFKLKSWSQLSEKHAMAMGLPEDFFAKKAELAKKAAHGSFAKISEILKHAR